MMLNYSQSTLSRALEQGWGAYEIGNLKKAEEHFQWVLEHEGNREMTRGELIDAHNGMGAVARAHNDFFDAWRWYKEAEYLLNGHTSMKKSLTWNRFEDRPALRTLVGLGHTAFAKGDLKHARAYYQRVLDHDSGDELGVQPYLAGIRRGKNFQEVATL